MKLARREMVWPVLIGALMGALAGHLISDLGLVVDRFGGVPLELIGLAVGAVLALVHLDRLLAVADALLLVMYFGVAFTPAMNALAPAWVRSDSLSRADAAVVLSSGLESNSALSPDGIDRLLTGLSVVRYGWTQYLVTTRIVDRIGGQRVNSDADQRRTIALAGAPRWDVVGPVGTTRDEAVRSAALLLPHGEQHVIVVTTPIHTRRACATFEKVGFRVTCLAAFEHDLPKWHPRTAKERLAAFRAYFYERVGMLKYRWRGWV